MRHTESRSRGSGRTQESILEAATSIFAAKGLAGARIDEIANLSGSNVRMIYHYFGSKEGLYEAVVAEQVRLEREVVPANEDEDPLAIMRGILEAYFDFCVENPSYVSIMLWEAVSGWKTLERIVENEAILRNLIMSTLEQGKQEGTFRRDLDVDIVIPALIAELLLFFPVYGNARELSENAQERERVKSHMVRSCLESIKR